MEKEEASLDILRRMLEDARTLAEMPSDPILEGRAEFLVAYVHDMLALKDPFGTIEHLVAWE